MRPEKLRYPGTFGAGGALTRVVERRAVAARAAEPEGQRPILDHELVGDELLADAIMAGDHARDRLRAGVAIADPDADVVADPQELAPPRVVDLDLHGAYGHELALLPRPREVGGGGATELAGEDRLERVALPARRAGVEVQHPGPRRARLIVAVADRHRHRKAGQVGAVQSPLFDQPRQHAHADAVRRSAARRPIDSAARTDGVAVARLEVGAANPPTHPRDGNPTRGRVANRVLDRPSHGYAPCQ